MRTVEEINAQIAVHQDNISQLKEQIDMLGTGGEMDGLDDVTDLEQEIAEEWGAIRELEAERDAI